MRNMNLADWLQRLELLHPKEIDLGLARIAKVAQQLPVTQIAHRTITVAGTNGKGTTVQLLANMLASAGLKVGCYTSPHLLRYNERIRVNGQPVDDQALCDAFIRIDKARGKTPLTYFEFGTLAAFDLFAREKLDVALLEVGLGGRLDATNIIDSDIAVITSIALDHQEWLGATREAIGYEKAGIMRVGAPAVCGDAQPPLSLIHHAESLAVNLDCSGQQFGYKLVSDNQGKPITWHWWGHRNMKSLELLDLPIPEIPIENASTAIQTIMRLGLPIEDSHIRDALQNTSLAGRYQRVDKPVPIILDVAHNPQATAYLAKRLDLEPVTGQVYALVGILADKDYQTMIQTMLPFINVWAACSLPTERALDSVQLATVIKNTGANAQSYHSVSTALDHLCGILQPNDLLVVFGSFYTVSEALTYLEKRG